jgi:hypothetical protein
VKPGKVNVAGETALVSGGPARMNAFSRTAQNAPAEDSRRRVKRLKLPAKVK